MTSVYVTLALAACLLGLGLRVTGIAPLARMVMSDAGAALKVMQNADLTDIEKEARIRLASLEMFAAFFSILARTVVALVIPAALIALGIATGLFGADQAAAASLDWRFLLVSAVLVTALFLVRR